MTSKKINEGEIAPLRIASLPTRPTAPAAFGGKGYTSVEMKAAFDKLPLLIIERFNSLIDDIESGEILKSIPTSELAEIETLFSLITGIKSGELANALTVLGSPLATVIAQILSDISEIKKKVGMEE